MDRNSFTVILLLTICSIPGVNREAHADFGWNTPAGNTPDVIFDVPALSAARTLEWTAESNNPPLIEGPLRPILEAEDRIVEIAIPVSSRLSDHQKLTMEEFRFEIHWNRNVYPLVDYGPKTMTGSSIEGLVSVEERKDRHATLGFNVNSRFNELVTGSANAQLQNKEGKLLRYNEIPQHEVVVASGTLQRGTGAFFRFHPSPVSTLEGEREILVAYRVPSTWRGGLIQVNCYGKGRRKRFAGFTESVEQHRAFVVPVYVAGDSAAREIAVDFVRAEQDLRRKWQNAVAEKRVGESVDVDLWIRESDNSRLRKARRSTPESLREAIDRFLVAKKDIVQLGVSR